VVICPLSDERYFQGTALAGRALRMDEIYNSGKDPAFDRFINTILQAEIVESAQQLCRSCDSQNN